MFCPSQQISCRLLGKKRPTSATCLPFLAIVLLKGLDLVLEAMVQVVKQYPQARLLVHGPIDQVLQAAAVDDPYAQRVKDLINVLGDHVVLAGAYQQHEIPQLMARIGWVVMASRWLEKCARCDPRGVGLSASLTFASHGRDGRTCSQWFGWPAF